MQILFWGAEMLYNELRFHFWFILWSLYGLFSFIRSVQYLLEQPNEYGSLAGRVVQRGTWGHVGMCFVLGMDQLLVPLVLGFFGYCAVGWWGFCSFCIWVHPVLFTKQLQCLKSEFGWYNRIVEFVCCSKIEGSDRMRVVCSYIVQNDSLKALCKTPMALFESYPQTVIDINNKRKAIIQAQNQRLHVREAELAVQLVDLEQFETTLYTFRFVVVTAVPMRVLHVIAFWSVSWCCSWVASCVYYYTWTQPMHEKAKAYVAESERFFESLNQAKAYVAESKRVLAGMHADN